MKTAPKKPAEHAEVAAKQRKNPLLSAMSRNIPLLSTAGVLILLYLAAASRYQNFASVGVFVNFLVDYSFLGVVAVGMTLVIVSGGIDLSVAGVVALCTVIMATLMHSFHMHPVLTWIIALGIGTTYGFLIGCIVRYFKIEPFIATLAGLFLARGLALVLSPSAIEINHPFMMKLSGLQIPLGPVQLPIIAVVMLLVVAVGMYVTAFTSFGRNLYAIGGNEDAAVLMGLPVGKVKILVYSLSGFLSALAAILFTIYQPSGDPIGADGMELDAIAVAVIGGTMLTGGAGNVLGTLLGVLIYGIIRTSLDFQGNMSSYAYKVAIGLLVLVFVVLQRFLGRGAYKTD